MVLADSLRTHQWGRSHQSLRAIGTRWMSPRLLNSCKVGFLGQMTAKSPKKIIITKKKELLYKYQVFTCVNIF